MRRSLVGALALLVMSSFVGPGHASTPAGAPIDPALALAALDRKIADLDSEEQTDKLELSRLGGEVASAHARVVFRGKAFYRLTRAGLLPVGGGFDALVRYAMRVERARRTLVSEIAGEARLRSRAVDLEAGLERVGRDRASLAGQRTAMDSARMAMQDEARRQAAFDRAFESSTGAAADYVPVYGGAAGGSPDVPAGGFAAARGRLLFPVAGRADIRVAQREGTDGSGLEIRASAGTVVRAAFAGRVAFADRYGPYGRIIILDHGDHYYTVSGNLDEIDAKIGQDVGSGERIGTVGDEGQGSMLYFEVRHGSRTVAAAGWLGL